MTHSSNTPPGCKPVSSDGSPPVHERLKSTSHRSLHGFLTLLASVPARVASTCYYPRIFGSFGGSSLLYRPMLLDHPQFMHIGSRVLIRNGIRMQCTQTNPERIPFLSIGDGTSIEQFGHIICHNRVIIGSNVAIAPMCGIVDATHPWMESSEITNPGARIVDDDGFVEIGDGTFIGLGTLILPGVRIGRRCFIGANSVVNSDIPDYSVAAGSPARVIRTQSTAPHHRIPAT